MTKCSSKGQTLVSTTQLTPAVKSQSPWGTGRVIRTIVDSGEEHDLWAARERSPRKLAQLTLIHNIDNPVLDPCESVQRDAYRGGTLTKGDHVHNLVIAREETSRA